MKVSYLWQELLKMWESELLQVSLQKTIPDRCQKITENKDRQQFTTHATVIINMSDITGV